MDATHLVDAFGALAQDTRLQVFRQLLGAGPDALPAGEVARRLGTPHNTMSTHRAILSRAGLARSRRESRQVIYTVDLETVRGLVAFLVKEGCAGQAERCAVLLDAAMPASYQPGGAASARWRTPRRAAAPVLPRGTAFRYAGADEVSNMSSGSARMIAADLRI